MYYIYVLDSLTGPPKIDIFLKNIHFLMQLQMKVTQRLLDGFWMLVAQNKGRTVIYNANTDHAFFRDIQNIALKYVGIDRIAENMVQSLGDVKFAYIIGDYAKGMDSGIIDLLLIGEIDQKILQQLIGKTEKLINRKIRPMILTEKEFKRLDKTLDIEHAFPIWGG